MEAYLIACQQRLKNLEKFEEIHVVLGNEACDLDSVVSCLVTSYLVNHVKPSKNRAVLPVLNIPRKDLHLRTEVIFFLEETDLSVDLLICRDEINLKKLHGSKILHLTLVDCHCLQHSDQELQSAVIEVIDHRNQEFKLKESCQATIERVGSCCTLVAEKVFKCNPTLIDPQIALLLYGTILLDTVCLDDNAQIATFKDREIVEKLEPLLIDVSREEVYEVLHTAKYDISGLTVENILRRDLKVIANMDIKIAFSSIPCLITTFIKKGSIESYLQKLCADCKYNALIIMGLYIDRSSKQMQREIGIYSHVPDLQMQLCKALEKESCLQLCRLDLTTSSLIGYHQGAIKFSRKFVLPVIQEFLRNCNIIPTSIVTSDCESSEHLAAKVSNSQGSVRGGPTASTYLLGVVGDPLSSQSSSTQNSCPYTPQNSVFEDSYDVDDADPHSLPSFNNREMIAKIEEKRKKLRGYSSEQDLSSMKAIPFTPKNSSLNIATAVSEEYIHSLDCHVLIEQLQLKKETDNQIPRLDDIMDSGFAETAVEGNSPRVQEMYNVSEQGDVSVTEKIDSDLIKEKTEIDAGINSEETSPDDSDTLKDSGTEKEQKDNRQNEGRHKSTSINSFGRTDPLTATHYLAETVDFPDSPQHIKLLKRRSREAQGLEADDEDEEDMSTAVISLSDKEHQLRRERPTTLNTSGSATRRRKITVNPDILSSDMYDEDQRSLSSLSNRSDVDAFSPIDDLVTPDDIDTPDDLDDFTLGRNGYSGSDPIPELSATEEIIEERNWRSCVVGGIERKIDMKVIEPYKKVLSHAGYFGPDRHATIVFGACYLPDRSRNDYDYVMDNLFLYVLTTLDQLVAEDYILIYFHGATRRSNMPSFGWLKRCYQMIDRRLRKNLKGLYLVHPTFWLKTIVIMTRPFISSKFSRKLRFINNLQELSDLIPVDHVCIPDIVKKFDEEKYQDTK